MHYTENCDIWSLGVVLYYLMTKSKAFNGEDLETLFQTILFTEPNFNHKNLNQYSSDLVEIIR